MMSPSTTPAVPYASVYITIAIYIFSMKKMHDLPLIALFLSMCHLRDVRLLILEHSRWSTIQKYQAVLDGLSVRELMEFVGSFKSELYAEGLVQGNFTSTVSFHTFYMHSCIFSRNIPDSKYPTNAADRAYSVLMYTWNIIKWCNTCTSKKLKFYFYNYNCSIMKQSYVNNFFFYL